MMDDGDWPNPGWHRPAGLGPTRGMRGGKWPRLESAWFRLACLFFGLRLKVRPMSKVFI
jgi:hypothetical protein